MTPEQVQALKEAALAVAYMRRPSINIRSDGQPMEIIPCWCQTQGNECIGQPQCHLARQAFYKKEEN